jgi:hypothetical protein
MRIAAYTTYCGLNDFSTIKPYPIQTRYPQYLVSNNENFLDTISKSFGYKPIFYDVPVSADPVICAKQSKVPKILPTIFKELTDYDYVIYYDDKIVLNFFEIESIIDELESNNSSMALRKHPTIPKPNVLFDFAESMYQWRYRCDWESMVQYITEELDSGYKLNSETYFATGVVLRNMKHPDTHVINQLWYEHTIRCSAVCQISLHFVQQRFGNIMTLPERIVNHWL